MFSLPPDSPGAAPPRPRVHDSYQELSMPSVRPVDSDESYDTSAASWKDGRQQSSFSLPSSHPTPTANRDALTSSTSTFRIPSISGRSTPLPATPASSQGQNPPTPMTSTPLPHANLLRSTGSASSKDRFATSGPWMGETPGPGNRTRDDTFDTSAIQPNDLDGDEDGAQLDRSLVDDQSPLHSQRGEQSIREEDQHSNGSFGSVSGAGEEQEEQEEQEEEEPFVSRREEGEGEQDEGDGLDAADFDIVDPSQHQSRELSMRDEEEEHVDETMQERTDRLTQSRQASKELSLVIESVEEEEEQDQESVDSHATDPTAAVSRSTYVQLGRRRSSRRQTMMPAPSLSPTSASGYASSPSSQASTPNGASQTSGHRSLVRSNTSYDEEMNGSYDEDGQPSPDQENLSNFLSPVKDYSVSIKGGETPVAQRTFQIQATPIARNEYYVPLQEASPNSQAGSDQHPASYETPRQIPPFRSSSQLRSEVVISALASVSRPKFRGTPRPRQSMGGASQTSIRQTSASPYQGGTAASFHSILHPDDQPYDPANQSMVSITSSEDLTNVQRANTSLPVGLSISDTPSRSNALKLQRHLHSLNTQQNNLIGTLQEENEALRRAVEGDLPVGVASTMPDRYDRSGSLETSSGEVGEEDLALLGRMAAQIERLEKALAEKDEGEVRVKSSAAFKPRGASLEPIGEDLSPQVESLGSDLASTKSDLAQSKELLAQQSQEIVILRTQLVELEASKARQKVEQDLKVDKLGAEVMTILTEKEAELAIAHQERDSLNEALKMKSGGRESVAEERVARLSAEVQTLREELGKGKRTIEALSLEVREALGTIQVQQEELELATVAIEIAQNERASIFEKLGTADTSASDANVVDLLERNLSSSDNQLARQQEKLQALEAEAALRTAELERVEGLLSSTTEDFAESSKEVASLKKELAELEDSLEEHRVKLSEVENQLEAQDDKIAQLEDQEQADSEEIEALAAKALEVERQLSEANLALESKASTLTQLEEAHSSAIASLEASYEDQIQVLEQALKEAGDRTSNDQESISRLNNLVQELETTQAALQSRPARSPSPQLQPTPMSARQRRSPTPTNLTLSSPNEDDPLVVALKGQLQTANFEIGRLQKELASSPFERTAIESREPRIRVLESANANGDLRKSILRGQSVEPGGGGNDSTIVYGSIQSPQTPKLLGPLRQTSIFDETPVPIRIAGTLAQIEHLKQERDERNESADANWEVQKDSLLGQLQDALVEVERLKGELDAERERRERGDERKETSGALLSSQLATLQRQLTTAKDELASTVRSKNTERVSFERKETLLKTDIIKLKEELEKQRKSVSEARTEQRGVKTELARTQAKISGFESDVASLQKKNASLSEELARSDRDKASFEGEAAVVKEDLESALSRLQTTREKVDSLQDLVDSRSATLAELESRSKATSTQKDGKSRELDNLVRTNAQLEAKLRSASQRSLDMTKHSDTLTSQLTAERLACHQLKARLSSHDETDRAATEERQQILRTIKGLRSDLKVVRSEAEKLGRELLSVQSEGGANGARDREAFEDIRAKLEAKLKRARNDESILKAQHKLHCKSFLLHIDYLKKKFTRENTFREDLSLQKEYLLILIGKLSRQQTRVNAAIAQMGYPGPRPTSASPRRTLKSVAQAVLFTIRTKNLAAKWKKTYEVATALREAAIRAKEDRVL